jgi:hypothetical protein
VRSIQRDNEDCFDIALTELLDSSGFGERLIPILRHTKSHLLRSGGDIIPRAIHVYAALADVQLPSIGDIDLSALAPFWLPARASMGEWMAVDLDDISAHWQLVSSPVQVFSVDFTADQRSIAKALCEHDVEFPLKRQSDNDGALQATDTTSTPCCNTIVWWFQADIGEGAPHLCNAPAALRPHGCGATHWAQAMACLGPWPLSKLSVGQAVRMTVRTDGTTFKWTPLGIAREMQSSSDEEPSSLLPLPELEKPCMDGSILNAWRQEVTEPLETVRKLRNQIDSFGDVARLQALQSVILSIAAQPGLFGLEATSESVGPLLKDFFV